MPRSSSSRTGQRLPLAPSRHVSDPATGLHHPTPISRSGRNVRADSPCFSRFAVAVIAADQPRSDPHRRSCHRAQLSRVAAEESEGTRPLGQRRPVAIPGSRGSAPGEPAASGSPRRSEPSAFCSRLRPTGGAPSRPSSTPSPPTGVSLLIISDSKGSPLEITRRIREAVTAWGSSVRAKTSPLTAHVASPRRRSKRSDGSRSPLACAGHPHEHFPRSFPPARTTSKAYSRVEGGTPGGSTSPCSRHHSRASQAASRTGQDTEIHPARATAPVHRRKVARAHSAGRLPTPAPVST